jgi:hypothetical protein
MNKLVFITLALAAAQALAAPGAHGPGGEHLDAPAAGSAAANTVPRLEAATDQFELVATLARGELAILIDRFESNEPVLGAQVQVESGGLKAVAAFRADSGDYAVADAPLLARLAQAGEHAIVFTVLAGADSDLLDGKLVITGGAAAADADHGHSHAHGDDHAHTLERIAIGGGVLLAAAAGVFFWRRRRARASGFAGGL